MADWDHTRYSWEAKYLYICADVADLKVGILPGFEISPPLPVQLMIAFSIELSIKSFLLENGKTVADLKKIGHDLEKGWSECLAFPDAEARTQLNEENLSLLAIISDLHTKMSLRYGAKSDLGRMPVGGPLDELANKFLELCNAPGMDLLVRREPQKIFVD